MSDQTIGTAMGEYLRWREAQDFSPHTIKNDSTALRFLMRVLGEHRVLRDLEYADMQHAITVALQGRKPQSVNAYHACFSAFFRWSRMKGYMDLDHDPLMGIRYRKVGKTERRKIPVHDFPHFLNSAPDERHRMFSALGLYLFLRASEAVALRWRDLDLTAGTIGVTIFKTNDYDLMPISSELDEELRRWMVWLQDHTNSPIHPDWYLVPSLRCLGPRNWIINPTAKISRPHDLVKRHLEAFGWEDTHWQGMHCLRASGARAWFDELVEQGTDGALKLVQTHLHHTSVIMTERYLGLSADRVKRDRTLKGSSMFPSLGETDTVLHLHRAG